MTRRFWREPAGLRADVAKKSAPLFESDSIHDRESVPRQEAAAQTGAVRRHVVGRPIGEKRLYRLDQQVTPHHQWKTRMKINNRKFFIACGLCFMAFALPIASHAQKAT